MIRVLSLGAGVQSSALLLMSCKGILPKLDCAVFADTQYEPSAVYVHLEWLKIEAAKAGIPLHVISRGNIRSDALEFRQLRRSGPEGDRSFAPIPLFVLNPDGSQGKIRRQCTSEYKVEPIERFIRRRVLKLKPRQRAPKTVVVDQWMGISADESHRAKAPGKMKTVTRRGSMNLLGESPLLKIPQWLPLLWKTHSFPLLNLTLRPDRRSETVPFLGREFTRAQVIAWLSEHYPGRTFPRSACLCCPFRSNAEWKIMKEETPEDFEDACRFDEEARERPALGLPGELKAKMRKPIVGVPFVHRDMIPLRMVDLDSNGGSSFGVSCGSLFNETCEGMCGV